jgi:hypothetical protein
MLNPNDHTLSGLVRLHAELGRKISENRREAATLAQAMKHVEAVIRLLDADFNIKQIAAKRRYKGNAWFRRGTMFRMALDVLRKTAAPLTAREIVAAMLRAKGVAELPHRQRRSLSSAVQSSLRNNEGKTVERVGEGVPRRWLLLS